MILIDAGPLVALISASDRHHAACRATLKRIDEPIATVWPAFTEAMYLLRGSLPAQTVLWQMVQREAIGFMPLTVDDAYRMRQLMEKYYDLPMDLADAALVRVAERERISRIFTIDRRDFTIYKPAGIGRFSMLPSVRR
ncbi:MAG TPA: PIN domain-containing protein [Thermoanaerobaculia bacterium]|jgi:predicted nucleic acid-binding protein|nr:PIN domain-containing protein [Thermoanaerobaculia bacterium]